MYLKELGIRGFRQFDQFEVSFQPGVTALVGRNDSGKSAIIDAVRFALQTRDQEYVRLQHEDFHLGPDGQAVPLIQITCILCDLTNEEKGAFIEYLSYRGGEPFVQVNWNAQRLPVATSRRWLDVTVRSGIDGGGPPLEASVRQLLSAAYLKPLRDAEREMSPGRGSRLSQILSQVTEVRQGDAFLAHAPPEEMESVARLSLVGLGDFMRHHVQNHAGVASAQSDINLRYLAKLLLHGDDLQGRIDITEGGSEQARLRRLLERLELGLLKGASGEPRGRFGLGSNNLLYMACELLLLGREPEGLPLLMIEEPEAHLHPQRQLRLMEFLSEAAEGLDSSSRRVQVLLSTHSPNLASKIPLRNLVLLEGGRAFSLVPGQTRLDGRDYRFLERFLDVTRANLFFAHGVLIVEGDAEAILLPTIAGLIGRGLTEHGVSIVNVGGKGLGRFGRIFQRKNDSDVPIRVPVACLADMDVLPNCAPCELDLVTGDADPKWESGRRKWKARRDFADEGAMEEYRARLQKGDGQNVRTFVSDHWTLEYDLAFSGLGEEVHLAVSLAHRDEAISAGTVNRTRVEEEAKEYFGLLVTQAGGDRELLSTRIYGPLHAGGISKGVTAQYLAELLTSRYSRDGASLRHRLPPYLMAAIDYVTRSDRGENPGG